MKIKPLRYQDVGIPMFPLPKKKSLGPLGNGEITLFDLTSHQRAREAMEFGLKMRHLKFHVFMVGEERSGRMTSTLAYLAQHMKNFPPPPDWVYLNNFIHPNRPHPFMLPSATGYRLSDDLKDLIDSIRLLLNKTFSHPDFLAQVEAMSTSLEEQVQGEIDALRKSAQERGLDIEQSPQGFLIHPLSDKKAPMSRDVSDVRERLGRLTTSAHMAGRQLMQDIKKVKAAIADHAIMPLMLRFTEKYGAYLGKWIEELKQDILTHIEDFAIEEGEEEGKINASLEERYAVNLLIDNRHVSHPKILLEPNPTYENLFGSIKYRATAGGGLETNFTMIRPGALHFANGGILVLRAESLTKDPLVWDMLKAALRDQQIRTEELHREYNLPLMDAPAPKPIPLDVQVFLIGAPYWYYSFFYNDPEFKTYFKIKADIDPDMPAAEDNLYYFSHLIRKTAKNLTQKEINDEGVRYLIGYSSRWVGDREKINSRFELISDVIGEASIIADQHGAKIISCRDVRQALLERRYRNARLEDRSHEDIIRGQVLIETSGSVIGQINALAVYGSMDHYYGMPSRISAKTYMGELGIINIERLIEMSGAIQQKGAFILDGFLNGLFAQDFPVSFNCSMTFEQSYAEIEGDSASLAELLAILSSLSGIPLRQDLAVTGSMNQFGMTQAVGGITHKIEGFYRICQAQGLSGSQGVIIPEINKRNAIVRDEVVQAIKDKKFSIWPVNNIFEAIELIMGQPAGVIPGQKEFVPGSVCDLVYQKLKTYHQELAKRQNHG